MEWKQIPGPRLVHISVSCGGVWGLAPNGDIFHRTGTFEHPHGVGDGWWQVEGKLMHLSVGYNIVWGVDHLGQVWYRDGMDVEHHVGLKWVNVPTHGPFKMVSVDRMGNVWAIDSKHDVYFRVGACLDQKAGLFWRRVGYKRLSQLDAGRSGVWAVDENKEIFYRQGTYGENGSEGSDWVNVGPGAVLLLQVASGGEDMMMGVTSNREVYMRAGITSATQTGSQWKRMVGEISMIDTYGYSAWGIDAYCQPVYTVLWPRSEAPMKQVCQQYY